MPSKAWLPLMTKHWTLKGVWFATSLHCCGSAVGVGAALETELVPLTVVVLVYTATLLDELLVDVCFDVTKVVCWGVDVAVTVVVFTAGAGGPGLFFPSSGGGFGSSDFAGAGCIVVAWASVVVVVVVAASGGGGSLLGAFEGLASSEMVDVIVVTNGCVACEGLVVVVVSAAGGGGSLLVVFEGLASSEMVDVIVVTGGWVAWGEVVELERELVEDGLDATTVVV